MNGEQILAASAGVLSLITGIFAVRMIWFFPGQYARYIPAASKRNKAFPISTLHISTDLSLGFIAKTRTLLPGIRYW